MTLSLSPNTKIFLSLTPVDMRKGFDGLAALVSGVLRLDPFSGHLFIFRGKRGDRLKALAWDGTGLVLYAKRLERSKFTWPSARDGVFRLTAAQFAALTEGLDWRRVKGAEMEAPQRV